MSPNSVVVIALLESLVIALGVAALGMDGEGLHWAIRWTARFSALFFLLAFLASSLQRALHRPWTAALLRGRRYWGLCFAASQLIHLIFIGLAYRNVPASMGPIDPAFFLGAVGYFFTGLMALSSNDAAVKGLGPRNWRQLHATGMYILWLIFMGTYVLGAGRDHLHFVLAIIFGLALIFKLGLKWRRRSH